MRIIAIVCLLSILLSQGALAQESGTNRRICFAENCFSLEIVDTPEARKKGLMGRDSLAAGQGMLFVFGRENHYSIWMKNMMFSIDILWLNKDLEIVHIAENVPPCITESCESIYPSAPASYVLELPAGTAASTDLKLGMTGALTQL